MYFNSTRCMLSTAVIAMNKIKERVWYALGLWNQNPVLPFIYDLHPQKDPKSQNPCLKNGSIYTCLSGLLREFNEMVYEKYLAHSWDSARSSYCQ